MSVRDYHVTALCHTVVLFLSVMSVTASAGDNSYFYQKCLRNCRTVNCTDVDTFQQKHEKQAVHLWLLRWTCSDECAYQCMWPTVDAFRLDGREVPQFHGKWPFVRVLGIQEPASMLFSILNLLSHLGIFVYRQRVSASTPMYYVWHGAAVIAANAWIWSTIYHTRDTSLTEKMDYYFAFSVVLYNMFSFCCRTLGTNNKLWPSMFGACLLVLYAQHVCYLNFVKFDYGYNMKMNVCIGLISSVCWLLWCSVKYRKQRYVWKYVVLIFGMNALLALELFDFAPFWWTLDAHALWHAGTAPMAFLWYSFIIADSLYQKQCQDDKIFKLD